MNRSSKDSGKSKHHVAPVRPEICRGTFLQKKMKMLNPLIVVAFGITSVTLLGQAPGGEPPFGPPGGGGRRPMPPLVTALDTNKDGKIDAAEIANAPAALATLDKNKDGKLTSDELQPPRSEGAPPDRGGDPPRFVSPLVAALDANKDGIISAEEIANASVALKTLDKNNDGELTRDEFMGRPPHGDRGGAGGRGPGFGGGPPPPEE